MWRSKGRKTNSWSVRWFMFVISGNSHKIQITYEISSKTYFYSPQLNHENSHWSYIFENRKWLNKLLVRNKNHYWLTKLKSEMTSNTKSYCDPKCTVLLLLLLLRNICLFFIRNICLFFDQLSYCCFYFCLICFF